MIKLFTNKKTPTIPDKNLLSKFKKTRDQSYLIALYSKYIELVYGVCLYYFKDNDMAQDAVMSIYEQLHKKLKNHEVTNFKSWLHVLTKNYCLGILRKENRNKIQTLDPTDMHLKESLHPIDNHTLRDYKAEDDLRHCIHQLNDKQKKVIKAFYYEDKSYKEIALLMQIDINKVRSFMQNGRRNLKICLESKK